MGSPFLAGVVTPVVILLVLAILPYTLDRSDEGVARWFNRPGRVAQILFLVILLAILALTFRGALR